jgi:hypothetical protein
MLIYLFMNLYNYIMPRVFYVACSALCQYLGSVHIDRNLFSMKKHKFFSNYCISSKYFCTQTVAAGVDPQPQTFLFWSVFVSLVIAYSFLLKPFLFVAES